VEKNVKSSAFENVAKGAILEKGRFGKTDIPLLWVEAGSIADVARLLREDPELSLDWLENLSVMQVDRILVASWFLRSRKTKARFVLRSTVVASKGDAEVDFPSTVSVWPEARAFESESAELFGIRFGGAPVPRRLLQPGFQGFPLRKNFDMKSLVRRDMGVGAEFAGFDSMEAVLPR
jgi:NADH:ubiquinone oxidoreductase subunit C